MRRKHLFVALLVTFLSQALLVGHVASFTVVTRSVGEQSAPDFISPEQLKSKLAGKQAVTIIDVRDTHTYVNSGKIKGALYFKLRRLSYRITMPPLKDLPRDREVVTYCACPHDEASIKAAQILVDAGFKNVRVLQGGWQGWLKVNGQTQAPPKA
jgi:phage shock protein E